MKKIIATLTIDIYDDGTTEVVNTSIPDDEKSSSKQISFIPFFKRSIENYWKAESFGTAKIYESTLGSLLKFRKKINWKDINPKFLNDYENYMTTELSDKSITTTTFYLQSLRRIMNLGIKEGIVSRNDYPFGEGKYQIPQGRNIKKSLDIRTLSKFLNYEPAIFKEIWAHSLWKFSFFGNGMNMKDVFNLKYENIDGDFFFFHRKKTFKTKKKTKEQVTVYITPELRAIIDRFGNKKKKGYIFPILHNRMTEEAKYFESLKAIRRINFGVNKICIELGIKEKMTTYVARHSWATTLIHKGISIAFVSKSMGHASIETTENYLAGFTNADHIKHATMLHQLIHSKK